MLSISYKTLDEGIQLLENYVNLRNQFKGLGYYYAINEDCTNLAFSLMMKGVSRTTLISILN